MKKVTIEFTEAEISAMLAKMGAPYTYQFKSKAQKKLALLSATIKLRRAQ